MADGPITERGDPRDRIANQRELPPTRHTPSPIDTIRDALEHPELWKGSDMALAALTEVEHQLAERGRCQIHGRPGDGDPGECAGCWEARAVAAETALAEANRSWALRLKHGNDCEDALEAAEQRANDLADALREAVDTLAYVDTDAWRDRVGIARPDAVLFRARAALDRHTQP
jgi:hypothetical protein